MTFISGIGVITLLLIVIAYSLPLAANGYPPSNAPKYDSQTYDDAPTYDDDSITTGNATMGDMTTYDDDTTTFATNGTTYDDTTLTTKGAFEPGQVEAPSSKTGQAGDPAEDEETQKQIEEVKRAWKMFNLDTLNNKGNALYNLGKYEEAITWYDKALAIDPNYTLAEENKEKALSILNKK